ncbi:MAG: DinB family protein [Planctomycetaceae bacterium]
MSNIDSLLEDYQSGADQLQAAVTGLTNEQLDAIPIAGKWSIRQVVCHIADFEPVYADRMKRVLVEDNPTMFGGDPNLFAAGLGYDVRDVQEEILLIRTVRSQMSRILKRCDIEVFQRTGVHSQDGPITLETLLERITGHIPHHVAFINEKRTALTA